MTLPKEPPPDDMVPQIQAGARGLWWVYETDDGQVRPELREEVIQRFRIAEFPYQDIRDPEKAASFDYHSPRFSDYCSEPTLDTHGEISFVRVWENHRRVEAVAWAEAVRGVYAAATDTDRRQLLEKYAAGPAGPVSAWALTLLARGPDTPQLVGFLRGLAGNPRLDPDAQCILDRELCRLDRADWERCPLRRDLVARWLAPTARPSTFEYGRRRVAEAVTAGDLDPAIVAGGLGPALATGARLDDGKRISLRELVGALKFRPGDRRAGFGLLADIAGSGAAAEVRTAAVRGLASFKPLSIDETAAVAGLRKRETDPVLAVELNAILKP